MFADLESPPQKNNKFKMNSTTTQPLRRSARVAEKARRDTVEEERRIAREKARAIGREKVKAELAKYAKIDLEEKILAEKAVVEFSTIIKKENLETNSDLKQILPFTILGILLRYVELVQGEEKRKSLIALFSYFRENLDFIKTYKNTEELIKIYNEKLTQFKKIFPFNSEIQAL